MTEPAAEMRERWLTPGVRGIGAASFMADVGHEIPTALLPSLLTATLGAPAAALGLIEGIADGLAGIARLVGGAIADAPPPPRPGGRRLHHHRGAFQLDRGGHGRRAGRGVASWRLGELPRYLTASVGGRRVGILHGDPESLAGWRLALEAMEPGDSLVRRQVGWQADPYRWRMAAWMAPCW